MTVSEKKDPFHETTNERDNLIMSSRGRKKTQSASDKQPQQPGRSGNDTDSITVEEETEILSQNQDETVDSGVTTGAATSAVSREELLQMLAAQEEKDRRAREEMQQVLLEAIGRVQVQPIPELPRPTVSRPSIHPSSDSRETTTRRINLAGLEKLEAGVTLRDFNTWRRKWDDHSRLERIASVPLPEQQSALRISLSPAMLQVVEMVLGIMPDEDYETDEILDKIAEYIRKKRSVALDRVDFEECRQSDTETFDEFYIRLQRIAECADLCTACWDERLTTKIISGIKDAETRRKLLALPEFPKLQDAVNTCRSEESAAQNAPILGRQQASINAVSKQQRNRSISPARDRDSKKNCHRCGRKPHPEGETCPARGKTCAKCHKDNHFAAVCRSAGSEEGSDKRPGARRLSSVRVLHVASTQKVPTISVKVYDGSNRFLSTVTAIPDSGAEGTIVSVPTLEALGEFLENLTHKGADQLVAANGLSIESAGRKEVIIEYGGRKINETVIVCPEADGMLLSCSACIKLGIFPENYPEPIPLGINTIRTDRSGSLASPETGCVNPTGPTDFETARRDLLAEFDDVFASDGTLPVMIGQPMKIELKDDAVPFAVNGPRPIPYAMRVDVKEMLDDAEKNGIITPVTEPTEWVHPFVPVMKPNGGVRLCVDLTKLNKNVKRPYYPLRTTRDAVSSIPGQAKLFSVFDADRGYWQIELHEDSQDLTTFVTPWGRYKFLRATMGLVSAGDEYCRRTDAALGDLPNLVKSVDDILIHGDSLEEHLGDVRAFLSRCRANKITLGRKKCLIAVDKCSWGGFTVSSTGISADPAKVEAIADFPRPTNITALRSFMGLAEQLGDFSLDLSSAAGPLRPLLRPSNEFIWNSDHDAAFQAVKIALTSPPVLAHFDPSRETVLMTDASRLHGLGFALLQKVDGAWKLIKAGSRFITDTESRYSVTELELTGVEWAMVKKCKLYLLGLPHFTLIVDHQALVTILDRYTLDAVENPKLQRMKERLAPFVFNTVWKKGKEHLIADALSRFPVTIPTADDLQEDSSLVDVTRSTLKVRAVILVEEGEGVGGAEHLVDSTIEHLRAICKSDADYLLLVEAVERGFPRRSQDASPAVLPYWNIRHELSTDDGIVLYNARLIIPPSARRDILDKLHAAHQGVERTKRRARQSVYWPGISSDILNMVRSCELCQISRPSLQKEPMAIEQPPSRPFEDVSADLFQVAGMYFLVYVDRFSGWPTVDVWQQRCPTARDIIKVLGKNFMDLGVPVRFRSDGGPQFASQELVNFLQKWGVTPVQSSPHFPQSNGHAEAAVKAMKALVMKTAPSGDLDIDAFRQALLEWRNTPRQHGRSPAQIVFGHPLRSLIPTHRRAFAPEWQPPDKLWKAAAAEHQKKTVTWYDSRSRAIPPIERGRRVRLQDPLSKKWDSEGIIIAVGRRRDYKIQLPNGRIHWRNRRLVRPHEGDLEAPDEPEEMRPASDGTPPPPPEEPTSSTPPPRRSQRKKKTPIKLNI